MLYVSRKERLMALTHRQHGRVTAAQLVTIGFARSDIQHWVKQGHLTPVLPRVYAVGHTAPDHHADLWAAVLYAGPGAALSHTTAAYHRGLLDYPPSTIEVTTSRAVRSIPDQVRVFARTERERELVDGIPTCLIPDIILDLAATGTPRMLKRALAKLDFKRQLTSSLVAAIKAACGSGRKGSKRAHQALRNHKPEYAVTNSDIEDLLVDLCDDWGIPRPICNHKLHGVTVDAYWPQFALVVEADGGGNHSTPDQVDRDRTNDLTLRSNGLTVLRYSKRQFKEDQALIRQELTGRAHESAAADQRRAA